MADIANFDSPVLSIEQDEHVATVWLDRPEARNAMGMDLWRDLPRAMAAVSGDAEVRAVVIAAKGPHFSVGLDLKAMGSVLSGGGTSGDWCGRCSGARPRPWRHVPGVPAPRSSGSKRRSPRSPAAPSPSSRRSTATASVAAST